MFYVVAVMDLKSLRPIAKTEEEEEEYCMLDITTSLLQSTVRHFEIAVISTSMRCSRIAYVFM